MKHEDPTAILAAQPMGRLQLIIIALCVFLNALDGSDVLAVSFASPGIAAEWNIDRGALGIMLSMELIGMAAGAVLLGHLADRRGRRPLVLGGAIATALTGVAGECGGIASVSARKRIMTKYCPAFLLGALTLTGYSVAAHDAETLDSMPAPHGGQVRMAGPYHIELVLEQGEPKKNRPVRVFLQDHAFDPMPSKGLKGSVNISDGYRSIELKLIPDGRDSLRGTGRYAGVPHTLAVVVIYARNGQHWSATFAPFVHFETE
jgi:hypothetical protein